MRAAALELIATVASEVASVRSQPEEVASHFAALSLARAIRLSRAMEVLRESGFEDVSAVPLRQVAEHATLGLYLLYGGSDAYEHLQGAYIADVRLIDSGEDEMRPQIRNWKGPTDRLKWQHLMHAVVPALMEQQGDVAARLFLRQLYEQVYRGQSVMAVHAGIGTIAGHLINHSDGTRRVALKGETVEDGTAAIIMAAALTGILGSHVLMRYGRDVDEILRLNESIQVSLEDIELFEGE